MARPKKNTVDYFPHDCHPNKELEIFINKHGNEGYAFYYRLFELLGVTPDHRYDCNKSVNYQYLLTKTGVKEDSFEQLMISLVDLDIVDKELWKDKIIWVQSFVDSIADVYKSRTTELPTKDSFQTGNEGEAVFPAGKQGFSAENGGFLRGNSQTKLKETKLKESGVKHTPHTDIPNWVAEIGKQYPRVDVNRSFLRYKTYRSEKGRPVNEDGFLLWVITDDEKDMNLKDKESLETTLYCVKCDWSRQVPADKTFGHLCDDCEDQMVDKHQLAAFRNQLIKEGQ